MAELLRRIPERDSSRTLTRRVRYGTPASAGEYDKILIGHVSAQRGYESMMLRCATCSPRVAPLGDETGDEAVFRVRCEQALALATYDGHTNRGVEAIYGQLAQVVAYGSLVLEAHWVDVDGDTRLNLNPVPLTTIKDWVDVDGLPAPQVQDPLSYDVKTVDPSRIVRVTRFEELFGPDGLGLMRALVFIFESWKTSLLDAGIRSGRETGGVIVTGPAHESDAQRESVMDAASRFAVGELEALFLPEGYTAEIADLPAPSDRLSFVRYFDEQIRSAFGDALESLVSSETGSRALGDSLAADAEEQSLTLLEWLVGRLGQELFAFIARSYGYTGRVPRLTTLHDQGVSTDEHVDTMVRASTLTGWYDDDRRALRDRLGLAPPESAGAPIELTPQLTYSLARPKVDAPQDGVIDIERLTDGRLRGESRLADEIYRVAQELRQAAIDAVKETGDYNRVAMATRYEPRLARLIRDYAAERRAKSEAWGQRIVDASKRQGVIGEATRDTSRDVDQYVTATDSAVEDKVSEAASVIVSRVLSELDTQLAGHGAEMVSAAVAVGTRITAKGLTMEAASIGHMAEQAGRLSGAVHAAAADGLVLIGVTRIGWDDRRRCEHCTKYAGTTYGPDEIPILPDPQCEGGFHRCRCGVVPLFGRLP